MLPVNFENKWKYVDDLTIGPDGHMTTPAPKGSPKRALDNERLHTRENL